MVVTIAPTYETIFSSDKRVFLAGGITGCPDWQSDMIELLRSAPVTLFNPRRKDFDIKVPDAAQIQIQWEFDFLRKAQGILFWFPEETLCPIVLFELGAWSASDKPIFVGCHPGYKRLNDVVMQMRLARPDVKVVSSISDLADQVKKWAGVAPAVAWEEASRTTTDGQPPEPGYETASAPGPINPETGQHRAYWVLSEEERKKGWARPLRRKYRHSKCGAITSMRLALCETYATNPKFYSHTFCVLCKGHLPVSEFTWDEDGTEVGS